MNRLIKNQHGSHFYDQLASEYDQMMDWESRLHKETPFFEKVLRNYDVRSILDVGCGTGRHCFFFSTLDVDKIVGIDPAANVVQYAQSRAQVSGAEIRFIEGALPNLTDYVTERFDLVCLLGNVLSNLITYDNLELTLKNLKRVLTPSGVILIQMINWDARIASRDRFFPPTGHTSTQGEKLFFRFFDFHDELVTMNLVIFHSPGSQPRSWSNRILQTKLRPWRREIITMALADTGFDLLQEYGGTDLSEYSQNESPNYIFIAKPQ
ncbi:class I SAM-dependent methyltransferase [bacterium]|nr:class I SAM-dependent methyltransferase [bacterium]MBU1652689.1 class I SAM-dependent methyltransferase [bacterium]